MFEWLTWFNRTAKAKGAAGGDTWKKELLLSLRDGLPEHLNASEEEVRQRAEATEERLQLEAEAALIGDLEVPVYTTVHTPVVSHPQILLD